MTQIKKQEESYKEQQQQHQKAFHCDVLLNNFQIKKKSYRVLLNGKHIVWENLYAKSNKKTKTEELKQQQQQTQQEQQQKIKDIGQHGQEAGSPPDTTTPTLSYGQKTHVLHIDEVINVYASVSRQKCAAPPTTVSLNSKPTAQYLNIDYAERILKSSTDCNRWHIRHLTLYNSDPYIVRQWCEALQALISRSTATRMRIRRLLVFINPYGGRKQGLSTYERHVKPVFQLAGIDASCIISQRANQIRDILLSHDLSVYDAVCCVGGDGTVAEVINGLIFRTMREQGIDEARPAYIPKPMLPLGVIPAGSTDTIAYSMHGTGDVRTAAIHLVLGQRRGLDVCSVSNSQTLLRFCASVLSYGYLGDVAAESEQYRWMGTKRYEYTGVKAFLSNRGYEAEIRMLLDPEDAQEEQHAQQQPNEVPPNRLQRSTSKSSVCYANCQRCSVAGSIQEQVTPTSPTPSNLTLFGSNAENEQNAMTLPASSLEILTPSDAPPCPASIIFSADERALLRQQSTHLAEHINKLSLSSSGSTMAIPNWRVIKGRFFMICGANITCACSRSPNGISRYSHLGDGFIDLILVRKTSLLNNVRFLLNTAGRDGDIRNLPFVEVYRTRKFKFRTLASAESEHSNETYSISGSCQPIANAYTSDDSNASSWNCDGEVVNDLDITMSSHCQLIDVFMRGPYSYTKSRKSTPLNGITTPNLTSSGEQINEVVTGNSVFCCCHD